MGIESHITADNCTFDVINEFGYFGSTVMNKNETSLNVNCRIMPTS